MIARGKPAGKGLFLSFKDSIEEEKCVGFVPFNGRMERRLLASK
jgi:hypothetical protein